MSSREFKICQVSDSEVIEGFLKLSKVLQIEGKSQYNFNLGQGTQQINFSNINEINKDKSLQKLLESKKSLIKGITININEQPRTIGPIIFDRDSSNERITVEFNNCPFERSLEVIEAIQSIFILYDPTQDLDKRLGPELADFYKRREQGLLRLEKLSQQLIEKNEEYRRKVDNELLTEKTKLKEHYDNLHAQLQSDIRNQKEVLDAREKELDDRKSTHARRQLRSDIKRELKDRSEKFNLTKTTTRKRLPIHILFIFLIGLILVLLIVTLYGKSLSTQDNSSKYMDIYHYIRLSILGISLIVTIVFYIHWIDQWAQIHADEEFRLKRLDLDIDRASWIVEMAMEWQAENKNEIPKDLLDRLSVNLFSENKSVGITEHPYEELIKMLLNVSAEAKVPIPGGGELRIDKQGMKSLVKSQT